MEKMPGAIDGVSYPEAPPRFKVEESDEDISCWRRTRLPDCRIVKSGSQTPRLIDAQIDNVGYHPAEF